MNEASKHWIVIGGGAVPEEWAARASPAWVVRLAPPEVESFLGNGPTHDALGQAELELARLVAKGLTTLQVAAELKVDHRTAQRRIARLREKFQVGSKRELAVLLAEAGL